MTGHTHGVKELDLGGLDLIVTPSLSAPDAYHVAAGFTGNREASAAYLIGRDSGRFATLYAS